jgi:transcriptional regulator with XRE-family HTH domain
MYSRGVDGAARANDCLDTRANARALLKHRKHSRFQTGALFPTLLCIAISIFISACSLRDWRIRRRLTQLDSASRANISTRHLNFLETGRSQPSRGMLLRLAELLDLPLRAPNTLLLAAGFAPVYAERSLEDPGLSLACRAIDMVLKGHEPYPAMAVNRQWELVAANRAVSLLTHDVAPALLSQPINVFRLMLHRYHAVGAGDRRDVSGRCIH